MAVHGDEDSSFIENAEFGPSFKGGLSALEDDDDFPVRSSFDQEFASISAQSPVKLHGKDGNIYAGNQQHGVRNNLTAAFNTPENIYNNGIVPPINSGINVIQPGLVSILSNALKPDGYQNQQATMEPGHRGIALSG